MTDLFPFMSRCVTYSGNNIHLFCYTTNDCHEMYCIQKNRYNFIQEDPVLDDRNGKYINHYSICDFPNKAEWAISSGLLNHQTSGQSNVGDLPAPFKVTASSVAGKDAWTVGECNVIFGAAATEVIWDSSTGLVTGIPNGEQDRKILKYTGKTYGTIPVGGTTITLPVGATLDYKYWYY